MSIKILALDTATEACSAALLIGDELLERYQFAPREHTQLLMPMVDSLMEEAGLAMHELDAIAFGRGPGSFTGLRIAAGFTQGLALGAGLPVVPVSDLAALALQAHQRLGWEELIVCQDARLQEFFIGGFRVDEKGPRELWPEALVDAAALATKVKGFRHLAGSGWATPGGQQALCEGMLVEGDIHLPRAADIARLGKMGLARGEGVPAEQALPVYLRDQVAKKQGE
jgi:tRNA threonylcarbamoyladenosine biosynthesis protein TsaB